jgi:hypothetical protein
MPTTRSQMPRSTGWTIASRLAVFAACLVLAACASFAPRPSAPEQRIEEVQTRTHGDVTVSVAIFTDAQARDHFGVDLGAHGVQAAWIRVRNASPRQLWFIRTLLDPDFYSADEVAQMAAGEVPRREFERFRQLLRDETMRVQLRPLTETEGFVYLPRLEGGRYLDVRLSGDVWEASDDAPPDDLRFGFAVPLPDGDFDYERLDPARIYADQALPDLDQAGLRAALERLPCCATAADGVREGDPLNIALVGDSAQVLNALTRAGWSFTHRITLRSVRREVGAAIAGDAYPVAPVSALYALGRRHDVALQRARASLAQRNHLRLWLAPFRFEGRQVWFGQISRDIGIKLTPKSPTLTTHVIDPEVDVTREYLLHSLLGAGLVERFGFVRGSRVAPRDAPATNLTDDPYFSDGMRLVVVVAEDPVPLQQVRNLRWERSAAPIAQGQTETARRKVRPIAPPPADAD